MLLLGGGGTDWLQTCMVASGFIMYSALTTYYCGGDWLHYMTNMVAFGFLMPSDLTTYYVRGEAYWLHYMTNMVASGFLMPSAVIAYLLWGAWEGYPGLTTWHMWWYWVLCCHYMLLMTAKYGHKGQEVQHQCPSIAVLRSHQPIRSFSGCHCSMDLLSGINMQ